MIAFPRLFARQREPRSVWFYTFHKCASSLFAGYVLKNIERLENINYERQIADGNLGPDDVDRVTFEDSGHIYGPIKLSSPPVSPVARQVLAAATPEFVRTRSTVYLTRDPRDILVSQYLSFTGAHAESKVESVARVQRANRERLVAMTLEQYVTDAVHSVRQNFEQMDELITASRDPAVTSYEEMVGDFDTFRGKLTAHMDVSDDVLKRIYNRSRPRDVEDMKSHKRSGKIGGFAGKLSPEVVDLLNRELADVLERFGYPR